MIQYLFFFFPLLLFGLDKDQSDISVTITGMTCGGCAVKVEERFLREPEVEEVSASFLQMKLWLKFKEKKTLSDSKIKMIVEDLSLEVVEIVRKP